MPISRPLSVQAAVLLKKYGKKADVARDLLEAGYSVTEISKAVPMAYSQVHSLSKKVVKYDTSTKGSTRRATEAIVLPPDSGSDARIQKAEADARAKIVLKAAGVRITPKTGREIGRDSVKALARQNAEAENERRRNVARSIVGVSPLRSRAKAGKHLGWQGECANCHFGLQIKDLSGTLSLVHVGMSQEQYLATVQFCTPVPAGLA